MQDDCAHIVLTLTQYYYNHASSLKVLIQSCVILSSCMLYAVTSDKLRSEDLTEVLWYNMPKASKKRSLCAVIFLA